MRIVGNTVLGLVLVAILCGASQAGGHGKGGHKNHHHNHNNHHNNHKNHHHHKHHGHHKHHVHHGHGHVVVRPSHVIVHRPAPVVVHRPTVISPVYSPVNCHWDVCAGESLASIAEAQYGNRNLWTYVARFNGITNALQFRAGLRVELPEIFSDGSMRRSTAPAPVLRGEELAGDTVASSN